MEKAQVNSEGTAKVAAKDCFLNVCSEERPHSARKTIRVPVKKGMISYEAYGRMFSALDLSMYGIGVRIFDKEEFNLGDNLYETQIIFPDRIFLVDTTIVHITPVGDEYICGLQITKTHDAGYVEWMSRVVEEIKKRSQVE